MLTKGSNTFDILYTIATFSSLTGTATTDIQTSVTPLIVSDGFPLATLPAVTFSSIPADMSARVVSPATAIGARPTVL